MSAVTTPPQSGESGEAAVAEQVPPAVASPAASPDRLGDPAAAGSGSGSEPGRADGTVPIAAVAWRHRVRVSGRVRALRVQPLSGTSTLECVIEDETGVMSLVFLGRSKIAGIEVGTYLRAEGVAGKHRGRLAILNPMYQLLIAR